MYKDIPQFFKNYLTQGPTEPEEWLKTSVLNNIPDNIEIIVDFGCGIGRNFKPFINKYKCVGFDLNPKEEINSDNFSYYQLSIEDFTKSPLEMEWSKCLVMTHGCLMYCKTSEDQNKFIKLLRDKGCKNFVFHEYASDLLIQTGALSENARQGGVGYLALDDNNLELFNPPLGKKVNFRDIENDLKAHICLEK